MVKTRTSATITDDDIRILKKVLSSHPTVKDFYLPDTEPDHSSSVDDDLQLAMAVSLSMVPEEEQRRREEEEELQRVLSLSLVDQ